MVPFCRCLGAIGERRNYGAKAQSCTVVLKVYIARLKNQCRLCRHGMAMDFKAVVSDTKMTNFISEILSGYTAYLSAVCTPEQNYF